MTDLPFTLETTVSPKVGLIVLQSDETIERDIRRLLPNHVDMLVSRVPSSTHVTPGSLAAMGAKLEAAVRLFPEGLSFLAIGYGCTSGTAQIGLGQVSEAIRAGASTDHVTEPVSALVAACKSLGVARIGVVSPYIASVSERLHSVLAASGVTVGDFASFNESEESRVARISPGSIRDAAIELGQRSEAEAIFLSCTNLRTLDVISDVEAAIGKPVLSSNLVLAWHLLRLAQIEGAGDAPGRIWATPETAEQAL